MNGSKTDNNLQYLQWKMWSQDKFGSFTPKDNAVFTSELRRARISLTQESSVLEIGFGNGTFAGWVRQKTLHYVGTEINPALIARAQQAGIEAIPSSLDLDIIANGRHFDLIAIFDVLEHMEKSEILQILNSARRCLSSKGRIIIRIPSGDSPFSAMFMYGDITHKTKLGSLAFYQIAAMTDMDVISVKNAAFPIFGFGFTSVPARLIIAVVRKIIGTAIKTIYYGNKPAVLSPNLVAVLRNRT